MNYYSAYGLRIYSNLPVPGLESSPSQRAIDVRVWLRMAPHELDGFQPSDCDAWYISHNRDESGQPTLAVWKIKDTGHFRIRYSDGVEFIIDRSGSEVWATWPDTLTLEDMATYLLGPIFGFLLRLRGGACLHASAIAIDGKAVALLGPAGAGKSTTAAALARLGYSVLSEDVVALCEQGGDYLAQPGYPLIRLWPDSVQALYGASDALPLLTPNWDKRYLGLTKNGSRFQPEPLPLVAIYFLNERSDEASAPFVEAIPPREGLITMVANTYTNFLLDQDMRAREFDLLGRLLSTVPFRRVTPHADPARLPELCRAIIEDFHICIASPPTVL